GVLADVAALDPEDCARRAQALIDEDAALRSRIISIGLPILRSDGTSLLRGPVVKVAPESDQRPDDPRLVDNGWVDLRPDNWRRWKERAQAMLSALRTMPGAEAGSRADIEPESMRDEIRPGSMAGWVFRHEDRGARMKRCVPHSATFTATEEIGWSYRSPHPPRPGATWPLASPRRCTGGSSARTS